MDTVVVLWLLLAGPLWGAIGAYLLPEAMETRKHGKGPDTTQIRLAGLIGGFAAGPLVVIFLWWPWLMHRRWLTVLSLVGVYTVSQIVVRVPDPNTTVVIWLLLAGPVWAVIGAYFIPRRYRERGLDDAQTSSLGALGGVAAGPFLLAILWHETPKFSRSWLISLGALGAWEIFAIFGIFNPTSLCVQSPYHLTYLSQQTINGLVIGTIYALMAVGLTLIYSVQGVISFAHGQFYMIGGYFSYFFLLLVSNILTNVTGTDVTLNPILGIPVAGLLAFIVGAVFERIFLRPMHDGLIERAGEYAILITFGFGFFIEYLTLSLAGPFPVRADRFIEVRRFVIGEIGFDNETVFGPINIIGDRLFATVIGLVLIFGLLYFLQRTWTGRALRATSMDKQAAAVTGIDPKRMNTLAFGMGAMLAAMAGAALIAIFAWVPWVGAEMAGRSYVIVVLGGLGSVPGALLGGWIVGVIEALGAGCFPDPSKGAAYKEAFALIVFALVLLLKPTGFFGREQL
jgi:branched-chain amino acid transport system permease protein